MAHRRTGRKLRLTAEVGKTICELVAQGLYLSQAAEAVGVSRGTVYRWLSEGANAEQGVLRQFYDAFKRAEGELSARNLARIRKAADDGTWQAAAWLLERRFPHLWGRSRPATEDEIIQQEAAEIRGGTEKSLDEAIDGIFRILGRGRDRTWREELAVSGEDDVPALASGADREEHP